jgi:hypothetical protein
VAREMMFKQVLNIVTGMSFVLLVGVIDNTKGLTVYEEQPMTNESGVKIVFPVTGRHVPVGELVLIGTSTDNEISDCHVYADWNDIKPFQKVLAAGPHRPDDYSTWTFSYTEHYHLIEEGSNELTAKLFCHFDSMNFTKYYTINVTGVQ